MAVYCGNCGKQLPDDARFCSGCGRSIPGAVPGRRFLAGMVRPRSGRKIAGVCQAIANHTGWDPTALRVIAVLLAILVFPVPLLIYLIFWLVLPEEPYPLPPSIPASPAG